MCSPQEEPTSEKSHWIEKDTTEEYSFCKNLCVCNELIIKAMVEAAGVEPASENVTGQETTCLFRFMPWALPQDVRDSCSERTRNSWR